MSDLFEFDVELRGEACFENIREDEAREFAGKLKGIIPRKKLERAVRFKGGGDAWLELDSVGRLVGKAKIANREVIWLNPDVPRVHTGSPNAVNNPGPGWEVDEELTRRTWPEQGNDSDAWTQFYARQVGLISKTVNTNN